jgi:hypothetical protein
VRGRVDDDLQPAPRLAEALQLLVAAQGRRHGGEELLGRQFRLGLVVVDVVVDDDALFGRLAGLAGAQDDAHRLVLQLLADDVDEVEAGAVGLHHHVEEHDGRVGVPAQEFAPLAGRAGRQQLDPAAVQPIALEREARAVVDGRLVVDHRHLPGRGDRRRRLADVVVDQRDEIRLVRHRVVRTPHARGLLGVAVRRERRGGLPR